MTQKSKGKLYIAISSVNPSRLLPLFVQQVFEMGYSPLVITDSSNRRMVKRLRNGLPHLRRTKFLYIPHFAERPASAAKRISERINKCGYVLKDWINFTDQTTLTFLLAVRHLGLSYPFENAYLNCRLKSRARSIAFEKGLSFFPPKIVSLEAAAKEVCDGISRGTAAVVKPICGAGSFLVRKVANARDWGRFVESARNQLVRSGGPILIDGIDAYLNFLVEPELLGDEFEVDGFVNNGKVYVCAIGQKIHRYNSNGFREIGGLMYRPMSIPLRRLLDKRLKIWASQLLKAVGFCSGIFHIEAMINSNQEIELIEINPRFGGGTVIDMVRKVSGISLDTLAVPLWLGERVRINEEKPVCRAVLYSIQYPDKVGGIVVNDAQWIPFWPAKKPVSASDLQKEAYVGEFHVHLNTVSELRLESEVASLDTWLRKTPLVMRD